MKKIMKRETKKKIRIETRMGSRGGAFCFMLCFACLLAMSAPRAFADDLDTLLNKIKALEAAAKAQGFMDLGVADMAPLEAAVELARSQAGGKQVHEVREALMKTAAVVLDGLLKAKQKAIEDLAIQRFAPRQAYYMADHAALGNGVWNDLTQKIADLAKLLQEAHALSFLASSSAVDSNFKTYYPGYAGQTAANFGEEFKKRMTEWESYAFGTLMANNKEAMDIKNNLLGLLSKLNDASDSFSAPVLGYRQLLQARNQIYIFVAQEVANMRLDVMRQIEARARLAANRQQKRTNLRVAFEKTAPAWTSQSEGKNY